MSIRVKVLALLTLVLSIYIAALYLTMQSFILPAFHNLENEEAMKDINRVERTLERETVHLERMLHDWASWDDSVEFVSTKSQDYIDSNLMDDTFSNEKLNLMAYYATDGQQIWARALDFETMKPIELPGFPLLQLSPDDPLSPKPQKDQALSEVNSRGIVMIGDTPMIVASRPVLTSYNKGPIMGTMIMGKLLKKQLIESLIEQTKVPFHIVPLNNTTKTLAGYPAVFEEREYFLDLTIPETTGISRLITSIYGKPAFWIEATLPKQIEPKGMAAIWMATNFALVAGLFITLLMFGLLYFILLRPIRMLTDHANSIEKASDFNRRLGSQRQDEFGSLARAFDRLIERVEKQTGDLTVANTELERLSYLDGLTRISNRRMFDSRLEVEWKRLGRKEYSLALIMGDIDHFKRYNDTYGHQAGDDCLRVIGQTIAAQLRRPSDLVARYGGEEFVILLPNTTLYGARIVAENIRMKVESVRLQAESSPVSAFITISMGVTATTEHSRNVTPHSLVAAADKALYEAKNNGRNRVAIQAFDDEETPSAE